MFIFIDSENEKCGETDGLCSNDPILKRKDSMSVFSGLHIVLIIILWVVMCIVCHYIRTNRRKRAIEELSREIQTIIDQNTQQVIVHVVPESSITNAPSTEQEQPPPTYHQATELKPLQN